MNQQSECLRALKYYEERAQKKQPSLHGTKLLTITLSEARAGGMCEEAIDACPKLASEDANFKSANDLSESERKSFFGRESIS